MLESLTRLRFEIKEQLEKYNNKDFRLSNKFKEAFSKEIIKDGAKYPSIEYLDYTVEYTNSNGQKIFFPNQWFYIATLPTSFVKELKEYREVIKGLEIKNDVDWLMLKAKDKDKFYQEDRQKGKDSELGKLIKSQNLGDDGLKLYDFVTDYESWGGGKAIDRNDFYVSPALESLSLVNSSQQFLAEIIKKYSENENLLKEALKLQEIVEEEGTIGDGINLIVYGAPGTGKSHFVDSNFKRITRTVFHPDYSYYDFVGAYKPTPLYNSNIQTFTDSSGQNVESGEPTISYKFSPGPFTEVLIKALTNENEHYTLLIEELNRSSAASVFGEIFQLLDRNPNGRSRYTVNPSKDLMDYLNCIPGLSGKLVEGLYLPKNMNLVATMNSLDQGVFPIDSAFKRRWGFKNMPIDYENMIHGNIRVNYDGKSLPYRILLRAINKKLSNGGVPEDRLIGPYFLNKADLEKENILCEKLFIYLWDDVLRHKREAFFKNDIKTFSELEEHYCSGDDIFLLRDSLSIIEFQLDERDDEESLELDFGEGDED